MRTSVAWMAVVAGMKLRRSTASSGTFADASGRTRSTGCDCKAQQASGAPAECAGWQQGSQLAAILRGAGAAAAQAGTKAISVTRQSRQARARISREFGIARDAIVSTIDERPPRMNR
jgi:hypothetical protein